MIVINEGNKTKKIVTKLSTKNLIFLFQIDKIKTKMFVILYVIFLPHNTPNNSLRL